MYKSLIRPVLFLFDAEKVHHFVMNILKTAGKIPGMLKLQESMFLVDDPSLERTVAGIKFRNPVGLAAGFDKDAKAIAELGSLGFGFIEIGTVTPKAQTGNPLPRLFRLPADQALINRMGFNNEGVDAAVTRLKKKHKLIVGGNIGKNKITENENAINDYLICFEALFPYCDYFTVNISSPNTPGLRELQDKEPLIRLLEAVQQANHSKPVAKPVFLKIAPDLTPSQVDDIIEITLKTKLAGLIISNTTISRESLNTGKTEIEKIGAGGLSGKPVFEKSTALLKYVAEKSGKQFALIASGGIFTPQQALEKLKAGADLVQLYTGFIYEGPALVKAINKELLNN
ncbi:MAG: quinone-dependent dihydroorotate dehydrogenase [Bacteroidetes bacterium]|nr:quinone-dependent dihydroorotate dehydrogenase [Bacteroidota bacterium]